MWGAGVVTRPGHSKGYPVIFGGAEAVSTKRTWHARGHAHGPTGGPH